VKTHRGAKSDVSKKKSNKDGVFVGAFQTGLFCRALFDETALSANFFEAFRRNQQFLDSFDPQWLKIR
jgi:hypothetical protein